MFAYYFQAGRIWVFIVFFFRLSRKHVFEGSEKVTAFSIAYLYCPHWESRSFFFLWLEFIINILV